MTEKPRRLIEVLPYDLGWPLRFSEEAERLRHAIGQHLVDLHHIGSTSVPGLAAKPIIDIIPEVIDIHSLDYGQPATRALEERGYEGLGEYGLPGRRYFRLRQGLQHLVHVHAYQTGNSEIFRHLSVRDYLRQHPEHAAEYAALKLHLAARFPHSSRDYQAGKDAFVEELERKALDWAAGE